MRGRAEKVVETLTWRKVDVSCIQEVRWRGASAGLIAGKNSAYKMYWVRNNLCLRVRVKPIAIYFSVIAMPKKSDFIIFAIQNFV